MAFIRAIQILGLVQSNCFSEYVFLPRYVCVCIYINIRESEVRHKSKKMLFSFIYMLKYLSGYCGEKCHSPYITGLRFCTTKGLVSLSVL